MTEAQLAEELVMDWVGPALDCERRHRALIDWILRNW